MMNWLWGKLESRVNTLVTRRILMFHEAMVRRGQIPLIREDGEQGEN